MFPLCSGRLLRPEKTYRESFYRHGTTVKILVLNVCLASSPFWDCFCFGVSIGHGGTEEEMTDSQAFLVCCIVKNSARKENSSLVEFATWNILRKKKGLRCYKVFLASRVHTHSHVRKAIRFALY